MLYETIQNWYKDAEVRGETRGKVGGAELIIELLETKFGVQPASMRATIDHFDSETLSKSSQRLFLNLRVLIRCLNTDLIDKLGNVQKLHQKYCKQHSVFQYFLILTLF